VTGSETGRPRIADWLRRIADRLDPDGAFRCTGMSFTFEDHRGLVTNWQGRGCPLWYRNKADYERAHAEAEVPS